MRSPENFYQRLVAALGGFRGGVGDPFPPADQPTSPQTETSRRGVGLSALAAVPPNSSGVVGSPWLLENTIPSFVPRNEIPVLAQDSVAGNILASSFYTAAAGSLEQLTAIPISQLALLSQRPEIQEVVTRYAKDLVRGGIVLTNTGGPETDERITALTKEMGRLGVHGVLEQVALYDGYFGRGHVYIDTGSGEDPTELMTPLALSSAKIPRGSLKGFLAVDPNWTYPGTYDTTSPLDPNFFRPKYWYTMGQRLDSTRLLTFITRPVSDVLKPNYGFGGMSLTQIVNPYVDNWLRTRQGISDLIVSFSDKGLKVDMGQVLSGGAGNDLANRVKLFQMYRNNQGVMVMDKEEEFFNIQTSLSTLDRLQAQAQEQIASAAGIPLVILLGITPTGLNASADGDIQIWHEKIMGMREPFFRKNLETMLSCMQLSLFGSIDPNIVVGFGPLQEPKPIDQLANAKALAEIDGLYVAMGVLDPEEIRNRLSKDSESPLAKMDLSQNIEPITPTEGLRQ